jgi:signal transduction histidine kinase
MRPVILLTGQGDADVADVAMQAGVSDFLEKGRVDAPMLERAIRYTLERKRAEAQIIELNLGLEVRVAERTLQLSLANQELEGFTHSVAHDIAGPLRSILSTSHILLEDHSGELPPEGIELLKRQQLAAKKLATLTDELLKLSRVSRQELQRADLDLSFLATEVAEELLSRPWPAPLRFEIEPGVRVRGDRALLHGVLQNLLENACKFSPDGGIVAFGARRQGKEQIMFVEDHGIGLNMESADRIFMPFERLVHESEFPGSGIGLANVERVVHRHGGRIWAESTPGEGTTFFFTLAGAA